MADEDDIRIRAELENHVSRPAREAAEDIEDIGGAANRAEPGVLLLERAINELADEMRKSVAASAAARKGIKEVGDESLQTAAKVKVANTAFDKMNRNMGGRGVRNIMRTAGAFAFLTVKIGAILALITLLPGALGVVTAAVVMLGTALTQMSGVVAALPGMFAALLQSVGALAIAFGGLGEAWKALSDPSLTGEELRKALKDVHPEAINAIQALRSFRNEWKILRQDVQGAFFEGMDETILSLGGQYLPMLRRELKYTAGVLNTVVKDFASLLGDPGKMSQIQRIMRTNSKVTRDFGQGFVWALDALLDLMDAARPMLRTIGRDFENSMKGMAGWTGKNMDRMTQFFNRSWEVFKNVLKVLWDFGAGLVNIFLGAKDPAADVGQSLADVAANFREWTGSQEGQRRIREFFEKMVPLVRAFGNLLVDAGAVLISLMENENTREFFTDFANGLGDVLPILVPVVSDLARMFNVIGDLLGPTGVTALIGVLLGFKAVMGIASGINTLAGAMGALRTASCGGCPPGMGGKGGVGKWAGRLGRVARFGGPAALIGGTVAGVWAQQAGAQRGRRDDLLGLITSNQGEYEKAKTRLREIKKIAREKGGAPELMVEAQDLQAALADAKKVARKMGWEAGREFRAGFNMFNNSGNRFSFVPGGTSGGVRLPGGVAPIERYAGGPVWPGQEFRVTERGPEMLLNSQGLSLLDTKSPRSMFFDEPGYVLPNEAVKALAGAVTASDRDLALGLQERGSMPGAGRAGGSNGGLGDGPYVFAPQISGAEMSRGEIEAVIRDAQRQFVREMDERRERSYRRNR